MSTHNICFHREIRKIFTGYPLLSRPMTPLPKSPLPTFKIIWLALVGGLVLLELWEKLLTLQDQCVRDLLELFID